MVDEKEMQEVLVEFQMLQQKIEVLNRNMEQMAMKRNELNVVKNGLASMKGKKDSNILVPVGSGLFVDGKLANDDSVLVEVGANIIVRKKWDGAEKLLEGQLKKIEEIEDDIQKDISGTVETLQKLEPKLIEFYQKSQK
jgi:prefoldin alpha subunit